MLQEYICCFKNDEFKINCRLKFKATSESRAISLMKDNLYFSVIDQLTKKYGKTYDTSHVSDIINKLELTIESVRPCQ